MGLSFSQNWDGVTAPAIPAGWNADAAMITSTSKFVSSPNSVTCSDTSNTKKYLTYATSSGDDCVNATYSTGVLVVNPGPDTFFHWGGISYRASSATISNASGVYYWAYVAWQHTGLADLILASVNNGTVTAISTVAISSLTTSAWYTIVVNVTTNVHKVQFIRQSDGNYMNSSGTFVSGATDAISATNSTITTGNYVGLVALCENVTQRIFLDDFSAGPYTLGYLIRAPLDALNASSALTGGIFG